MHLRFFDYRFADEILRSAKYRTARRELLEILRRTPVVRLEVPKKPRRASYKGKPFTTDQRAINKWYEAQFRRNWDLHPEVTGDGKTGLEADFKRDRIQVEIQFGNMARWYTDVFKMQVSYSLDKIDVGVLVAPVHTFANTIDENVAYFERIVRELPYAKMSITLPILVVGLHPELGTVSGQEAPISR